MSPTSAKKFKVILQHVPYFPKKHFKLICQYVPYLQYTVQNILARCTLVPKTMSKYFVEMNHILQINLEVIRVDEPYFPKIFYSNLSR